MKEMNFGKRICNFIESKSCYIFMIGYFILLIATYFVNVVFLKEHLTIIKLIGLLLITISSVFRVCIREKNLKNKILILSTIPISILYWIFSGNLIVFKFVIILLYCKYEEFNVIVKTDMYIKTILFIVLILLSFVGLTNDFEIYRGENARYSFGFFHPNTFSMYVTILFMEYFYVFKNKLKLRFWLLIGIILSGIIIILADSRTAVVCLIMFLIYLIFEKRIILKAKLVNIIKNLYLILLILSIVLTMLFPRNIKVIYKIDTFISGRIWIQNKYMNAYDVTLFGNKMEFDRTLDNVYIRYLLNYGVLATLALDYMYRTIIKNAYRNKNILICAIFTIIALYGLMENVMFDITFNIFWIYVFKKSKITESDKNQGEEYSNVQNV